MKNRKDAAGVGLAIIAVVAQLIRRADGAPLLPSWIFILAQIPFLLIQLSMVFSPKTDAPTVPVASDRDISSRRAMIIVVCLGGIVLAFLSGTPHLLLTAMTVFGTAGLLLEALTGFIARLEQTVDRPRELWSFVWPRWLGMAFLGSILLALPVATHSGVPDYTHNFLQHVLNSAFSAFSTACLVGTSIYSLEADYTVFGQIIIVLLMHLAGVIFSVIGLATVRPFCRRKLRVTTLLRAAFSIELVAAVVMITAWNPRDAPSLVAKCWWSIVHAGSALWNGGLVFRVDGLAAYLENARVFSTLCILAILGSIGLPIVLDMIGGKKVSDVSKDRDPAKGVTLPRYRLPMGEAIAALALLLVGAVLLFCFESPGNFSHADQATSDADTSGGENSRWLVPANMVPRRPFDLGENQVPMHELSTPAQCWRAAVFVSATLRSAGMQSIPVCEGALTWPSVVLILTWMFIGGSAGGVAGGMKTSMLVLLALGVFGSAAAWRADGGGPSMRRTIIIRMSLCALIWLGFCAISASALALSSQGTAYEIIFDSMAAANGVGLSTGLTLHLTWAGRIVMILTMVGGRCISAMFWLSLAEHIANLAAEKRTEKKAKHGK